MAVCTFFGHRYAPLTEAEKEKLTASITDLVTNHDVTEFWVGAKGEFDFICSSAVTKLKKEFPNIKLTLVLSYIPTNKEDYEWKERYYDHIFLPDGVEVGPQRFAIIRRNRWMALNTDYMICYVKRDYGGAYVAMKTAMTHKKGDKHMSNIVCKYALICSMMFITTSALAGNERIMSFNKAKNDLKNLVYYDHHQTFYCHVPFDVHNRTILPSDFYIAKHKKRAGRMEWEHIVPAENFGRAFREWRVGDPACVNKKGQPFKGRRCANKTNSQFRMMQADMYNLYPSVGAVNAVRSNYNFAELPEDVDFIIDACNFKVLGHKVEPVDMCKGEIARTYLYFDSEYPTYSMSKQSRRMMDAWNVLYPVTPWECTRAKRIEEIQGNPNPFVKEPCIEQGLYR